MKADLIFVTEHDGIFNKAIAWFTGKKKPAKAVHVAGITNRGSVIEALTTVRETPFLRWVCKHKKFEVWRNIDWTENTKQRICDEMLEFKGRPYGFHKLFVIALDLAIAKVWKEKFLSRRLLFSENWPICTWVYAYAVHEVNGYEFGVKPEYTDPCLMRNHCLASREWKLVEKVDKNE